MVWSLRAGYQSSLPHPSLSVRMTVLSSTPPSLIPPQSTRRNPFGFEQACLDEPFNWRGYVDFTALGISRCLFFTRRLDPKRPNIPFSDHKITLSFVTDVFDRALLFRLSIISIPREWERSKQFLKLSSLTMLNNGRRDRIRTGDHGFGDRCIRPTMLRAINFGCGGWIRTTDLLAYETGELTAALPRKNFKILVPLERLELLRLTTPDSKSGTATNYVTEAKLESRGYSVPTV